MLEKLGRKEPILGEPLPVYRDMVLLEDSDEGSQVIGYPAIPPPLPQRVGRDIIRSHMKGKKTQEKATERGKTRSYERECI